MAQPEGSEKPRVFLESDDEIRGQKYVCLSFLTPNRGLLRNKELYFFSKFLEFYAMDYKIRATESFVLSTLRDVQNQLSDAQLDLANAEVTDLSDRRVLIEQAGRLEKLRETLSRKTAADLEEHVKANLNEFKESNIIESWERYMTVNRQRLEDEFHKLNEFQTTIHGLKVRGVYSTREQADVRGKALHKKDPYFSVYVADVGEWLAWDPEPDNVESSEYANEDLNKLMKAYKDEQAKKDAFFEEEKREKMAAAAAAVKEAKERRGAVFGEQGEEKPATAATGIFDAPADIAIARKIANEAEAARVLPGTAADAISHS
jgi:hypothetical protein